MERRWRARLAVATILFGAVLLSCMLSSLLNAQIVPLGTEFRVNTYTTDYQALPSVAAAGDGGFVVVWDSVLAGRFDIFGQRYASSGSPLGTEFRVNSYTVNDQRFSAAASATNGDFVVVWMGPQAGSSYGIFGQRYASSGGALGTEFQVNTHTTTIQQLPAVAAAGNGDFVVVWSGEGTGIGGILGRRYASSGSPLGTEFQVSTYSAVNQGLPVVAAASTGDFVVAWQSEQDGSYYGVFAQRYASSGSALGTEFQVNTYTTDMQDVPAVAAASNGDFVVVWTSNLTGTLGIFGQRYASSGSALGTEFQVSTYKASSPFPAIAAASSGDFIVVWESNDGWYDGVFAQRYASSGSALGTEFQVNTYIRLFQAHPAVAAAGNGDFVVVWMSPQDGSSYGIFGQRYGPPRCATTPLANCAAPGKSVLFIKDESPAGASAGDKLIWKWLKGPITTQADFGDPTMTASYRFFCIYTGTAQTLALEAVIPPGTNWQPLSDKGYKYKNKTGSAAGITQILLKGEALSKILVKGKNEHLDLTPTTLPLDGSADVMVQLSNTDNSNCWQASFPTASVKKNTDAEFKARTPP